MKKNIIFTVSLCLFFLLSSCTNKPKKIFTPLELQMMQSRKYESSKDIVFASVISVFQDLGYTITNADKNTGLVYAESPLTQSENFFVIDARQTKATAFIEKTANKMKVRLNFVNSNFLGAFQRRGEDKPVLDPQVYQNAFNKIEHAIFFRKNS